MHQICVLGSTGSIGVSTLDVIQRNPELFQVASLAANTNVDVIFEQCLTFSPRRVALVSEPHAKELAQRLNDANLSIEVLSGEAALCGLAVDESTDTIMAAIVGAAGLLPTYQAIKSRQTGVVSQ